MQYLVFKYMSVMYLVSKYNKCRDVQLHRVHTREAQLLGFSIAPENVELL